MIKQARALNAEIHATQRDKLGMPYVAHPARVAANVQTHPRFSTLPPHVQSEVICAAYLHDTIEDGPSQGFAPNYAFEQAEFPEAVFEIVTLLTKPEPAGSLDGYYNAIAAHPLARMVKLADIADNTNVGRSRKLPDDVRNRLATKYVHALDVLSLSSEEHGWLEERQQKDV
jgi:(p)ppGpp synthase/HD superfamily hydrolase